MELYRWIKASERLPIVPENKQRHCINIKYKGTPDTLLWYHGSWYWSKDNVNDSLQYPVHNDSWSAIEWLEPIVESNQDELWNDVKKAIFPVSGKQTSNYIEYLSSKYLLTKR